MNRRKLLKSIGVGAASLTLPVVAMGNADNSSDGHTCPDNGVCEWRALTVAKEYIAETGEWNQYVRGRIGRPLIYTVCGGTCCEVSLRGSHPDWEFTTRRMRPDEIKSFREEFGRTNWLLLGIKLQSNMTVRGFVLDGRREGWNISVRTQNE